MKPFSNKAVTRAGEVLRAALQSAQPREDIDKALEIFSHWRADHEKPTLLALSLLTAEAKKVDNRAITAKRLKRVPSVIRKLERFNSMQLRNMQDIGGCRAILSTNKRATRLAKTLIKLPNISLKNDYITSPKPDGYRGIHLASTFPASLAVNRKVEIQIRSTFQHSWATAVEIYDLISGQAIKSNEGSVEWKEFFKLAGEAIALFEEISSSKNLTPNELTLAVNNSISIQNKFQKFPELPHLFVTLRKMMNELKVTKKFETYTKSIKSLQNGEQTKNHKGYILLRLEMHISDANVEFQLFEPNDFEKAQSAYLEAEKKFYDDRNNTIALVSTDSIYGLQAAYPNYFADSERFVNLLIASRNIANIISPPSKRFWQ